MGKKDKIRGANVRALMIFRRIQKIKKEELDNISTRLQKRLNDLMDSFAKKKQLDQETIKVLKIYLGKKDKNLDAEDKLKHVLNDFIFKLDDRRMDGISKILLFLSPDGELYRKPKSEHSYPMDKSGKRLEIIRFLIGRKNFTPCEDIAKHIETSRGSTAFAIKKINDLSKFNLDLPENERLIISKNRGGYKLNPLYPITKV